MDSGRLGEWINRGVEAQYKGSKQYLGNAIPVLRLLSLDSRGRSIAKSTNVEGEVAVFEAATPYTNEY